MGTSKWKAWCSKILVFVLIVSCTAGVIPQQVMASTATPSILITEIVPASKVSGQPYEFVEIYNNTSRIIDLTGYTLKYYSTSFTTSANTWTITNKKIQPRSALVLWLQKYTDAAYTSPVGSTALSDFNTNYGVNLSQDQVFGVKLVTPQGLHDTAPRRVTLNYSSNDNDIISSAYINNGSTADGITNKSVTYQSTSSSVEMTRIANGQIATPGVVLFGQAPGPHVPTGVNASPGNASVTLSWAANADNNLTGYHIYQEGVAQPATVTNATYVVTGLANNTTYNFRVTAIDANGDESPASPVLSAMPQAVVDTTPPAAPIGVSAAGGTSSVTVNWQANTESDIGGYKVYMGGNLTKTVSAATYQAVIPSLISGQAYTFQVSAFDKVNNESPKSAAVRAVPDLTSTLPDLFITELMPDTDNHFAGYDGFEFVELYNNSSAPIDLNGYTLKLESSDSTKTWQQAIDGTAVIPPRKTFILWTRKGELAAMTKAQFNQYYYSSFTDRYVPENRIFMVEGVPGLLNTFQQSIIMLDTAGNEIVRASYNDSASDKDTSPDNAVDKGINYSYPTNGGKLMRKVGANVAATPGQIAGDQIPAISGSDLQPPAAPTGVNALPGSGFAALSWTENSETDLASYQVYKNGELVLTVPKGSTQAQIALLTGSTTYTFEVAAVDVYGNVSAKSTPVTAVPSHQSITQVDRSITVDKSVYSTMTNFWNLSQPGLVVPGLAQDIVPQGLAYYKDKDWILVSNYREDGRPSTLSVVDAKTNLQIKSVNLYQEDNTPYTGHAGGVSVSKSNIWIASGGYMHRIPLSSLMQAADQGQLQFVDRFLTSTRSSIATYNNGILWVGEYYQDPDYPTDANHKMMSTDGKSYGAWLAGYQLDASTDLIPTGAPNLSGAVTPNYILSIPGNIQGADFAGDQIILSQSFTRAVTSNLLRYRNPIKETPQSSISIGQQSVPVWFLDSNTQIKTNGSLVVPPMAEGLLNRDGKFYVLFESGANTYRSTANTPLDRVQVMDLKLWDAYGSITVPGVLSVMTSGTQQQLTVLQAQGYAQSANVAATTQFISSNAAVAEVISKGVLFAKAAGSTVITATYGTGTTTFTVTVASSSSSSSGGSSSSSAPQTPAKAGELVVSLSDLKVDQGKASITLPADKQFVTLPANLQDTLKDGSLQLTAQNTKLTLSKAVLQSVLKQLKADALKDSTLSLSFKPVATEQKNKLVNQASQRSNASLKLAGDVIDFTLTSTAKDGSQTNITKFDQPITVTFKINDGANSALLGVYSIRDDGSLEYVGGRVNNGVIEADLYHFSQYAVLEYSKSYTDVPADHWAAQAIRELSAKHIVEGTGDTQFSPSATVTRAEFTALLARALGLKAKSASPFADVASSAWYADAVSAAAEAGIVSGTDADHFAPEQGVSREQMATMLVRAALYRGVKIDSKAASSTFADEQAISDWAKPIMALAASSGLIQGNEHSQFEPQRSTSRAESAQAIYNMLQKK
ncbi:S-layer homology domain-containing protein [Paenibacillus cremeus]|nr:S-layer homology domain-containing protein [Paenibacillus cremeus]